MILPARILAGARPAGYLGPPAARPFVSPPRAVVPVGLRDLPTLIQELKRRRVFRVAVAYLAVAWVTIDVSDTLLPALGAPDWAVSVVVVLVILAFPLVLILGWIYDVTPHGIERTESLPRTGAPAPTNTASPRVGPRESIVVLPLRDRSPGGEHQFLGDGITEELIHGLARVDGLRVVSRTSAFALGDTVGDVRELGARLGVGSVVEGSLLVREHRLRLNVQFVSAEDGMALWSQSFDRRIDDVFEIQEDVARSIVGVVGHELGSAGETPAKESPLLPTSTRDVEAYQLYLKGRHHWNKRTGASLRRAIEYFERATKLDGGFAQAWAGLAESWALLMEYGLAPLQEGLEQAREAARRALGAGGGLAEAHAAAALVRQLELDLEGAASESEAALALNPGYAPARHRWSLILAWLGRFDESRREIETARALDPLAPAIAATAGWVAYYERAFADAVRACEEVLEDHPTFATGRIPLGLALVGLGQAERAVEELRRSYEDSGRPASGLALLAYAEGRAGRTEAAAALDAELLELSARTYVPRYYLALPPMGLGQAEEVLTRLSAAVEERAPQLVYLGVEPIFDPLRDRPEFGRILEEVRRPR
jgi:TolB-like protein/Tfp pilus assembly protein PilF